MHKSKHFKNIFASGLVFQGWLVGLVNGLELLTDKLFKREN